MSVWCEICNGLSYIPLDVMSVGLWPLLKDLEDPKVRHLAQPLPATVLRSRAHSTTNTWDDRHGQRPDMKYIWHYTCNI